MIFHCARYPNLHRIFRGVVAWSILDCARRTSTFLSCAFREQEDDQATPPLLLLLPGASQGHGHRHGTDRLWLAVRNMLRC